MTTIRVCNIEVTKRSVKTMARGSWGHILDKKEEESSLSFFLGYYGHSTPPLVVCSGFVPHWYHVHGFPFFFTNIVVYEWVASSSSYYHGKHQTSKVQYHVPLVTESEFQHSRSIGKYQTRHVVTRRHHQFTVTAGCDEGWGSRAYYHDAHFVVGIKLSTAETVQVLPLFNIESSRRHSDSQVQLLAQLCLIAKQREIDAVEARADRAVTTNL